MIFFVIVLFALFSVWVGEARTAKAGCGQRGKSCNEVCRGACKEWRILLIALLNWE